MQLRSMTLISRQPVKLCKGQLINESFPGRARNHRFLRCGFSEHFFETQPFGPDFYRKAFQIVHVACFYRSQPGEMFIKSCLDEVAELVYMSVIVSSANILSKKILYPVSISSSGLAAARDVSCAVRSDLYSCTVITLLVS
jgi:hypothetical protein